MEQESSSTLPLLRVFSREEAREWSRASNLRGFLAVGTTWSLVIAAFTLFGWVTELRDSGRVSFFLWGLCGVGSLVILGGRQLALGILMHEAAHRSLFASRRLNEWVGRWLCAYPTWQDLGRYRTHHLRHHRLAGTAQDPDLDLVTAYPTSAASLLRKFLRDLAGITGLRRVFGLLLIDFGFYEYTVSGLKAKVPGARERSFAQILECGLRNLYGVIFTQVMGFLLLWSLGRGTLYGLWVVAYLVPFSIFVRIRSIAEHAVTEQDPSPFRHTRTTYARFWERLTVAPHRVNYHLEHHLLMSVPYFRLPAFHDFLKKRGALGGAQLEPSYVAVLRLAASGRERKRA
jgi:fatty acid desaturase